VKDIIPENYDDICVKVLYSFFFLRNKRELLIDVFGDRLAQVMVVALLINDRLTLEYLVIG
jgi:hypothetical protein